MHRFCANTAGHLWEALDQPPWMRRDDSTYVSLNWVTGGKIIAISQVSQLNSITCPNPPIPGWEGKQDRVWLQRQSSCCTARAWMVSKCSLVTKDSWSHSAPCRWQLCADLFRWRVKREGEVSRRWQQSEWEAGPWGWTWPSRKSCSGILNVSEEQLLSLPKFLLPSRIVSPNKGCNSNPKTST